jgi:uroporphyrin-III C-methyltransferase
MAFLAEIAQRWSFSALADLDEGEVEGLVARFEAGDPPPDRRGSVTLVGAGPGDPGLLSEAARAAIAAADLVICDRIVPPELRAHARGDLRIARKYPGRADRAQAEIDAWMVAGARAGKSVVRLKCGDPFVFGRGHEEVEHLRRQGIEVRVVPGISSAFAAPAAVGIPLTLRGVADRVEVSTGHGRGGAKARLPAPDPRVTRVFLMGVGRVASLVERLIALGHAPELPAAIVERATWEGQRAGRCSLAELPALVERGSFAAPAVLVLGSVVALAPAAGFEIDELPEPRPAPTLLPLGA